MTTAVETTRPVFLSPLGSQLEQFLALKRAMGYRYREESRLVGEFDEFLVRHLSTDDPVLTLEIARDYVTRRGTESDSTRAHRLTIVREVARFLRLDDARTVVPGPRFLGILRRTFVPNRAIAAACESDVASLAALVPWIADRPALEGRPTAYVCVHGRCDLPVHEPEALAASLAPIRPAR